MSLLSKQTRSRYLEELGLEYNKHGIKRFQQTAFINPAEHDGKYGKKTDAALRHWHNVRKYTDNFAPEEFRCPCGRCTGYPTHMKANELKNLQAIRTHFGKPMTITSGLRCEYWNGKVGGVSGSKHLEGRAADFYAPTVTDSLARRKVAIEWMKRLPKFRYAYCDGYDSYGQKRNKSSMGNAIHIDSKA